LPKRLQRGVLSSQKGSVMLELIVSFLVFFAVISFTINFFVYAYSSTVLSLAAQEAGRITVSSFRPDVGRQAGLDYLKKFGVGNLIKNPTVDVSVKKMPQIENSVIEATASGNITYARFGAVHLLFSKYRLISKTATYYLELTFQSNEHDYVVNKYGSDIRGECLMSNWGDGYDCY
jgi:hypothetical protein